MPLTIPQYITIRTAAGSTAAFLSPSSDGLKECFIDNELNGSCTLTFSLPTTSNKKQYLTEAYRIYAPDSTGVMKEFVIITPDSIDRTRDGKEVWDKITAQESWVKLGKDYVDPGISNDPQTPSPPALAVIVLSGGSDLSGGLYTVGSAAHALYAILQGTGWSVGTADQTGTHDLETEKISVLANIQKIQETWGGYLVWDSVNKTVSLRDETAWAPYTGYQIRYAKNLKGITRTSDFDIITKLYPFGEDDLNIGSVNGGVIYLSNNTYTAEILEGIYTNQDLATAQTLKDDATKYLAKVCKPRHNYRIDQVDLRTLSGYAHENFDVGHMVDIIDADLDANDQARVIRHRFAVFQPWICELEVGDPVDTDAKLMADSKITVKYLNSIKTSKGEITGYKIVDGSVISQKIATAAVDATKLNTKVIVLLNDTWTDNSPAAGSVAWNQHTLVYAGVQHVMLAGNTALKYIYWDGVANTYSASATLPDLADGQFYIAVNNAGLHDLVWNAPTARQFIGSLFIADAAIKEANIADLAVTDAKIASLTANKITTGQLLAYLVEIMGKNGYFRINGDEFLVYDKSGALMGRFGHYETLAALLAAFTRASTSYDSYGNLIASGVPRYPYMALPGPVWYDPFDADQLAAEYTSGGDVVGTPTVSGGVLTYTGGTQATLIKNNLLLQDCDIVVNSDQVGNGGIIARYQDNNNFYLLQLFDDSGSLPAENLRILKRIGGVYTVLASVDVTWVRGVSKPIKFSLHGSRLEAYFDGVKVIEKIDTTYTGGGVGLRNSSATAFRVLDFTVYYAQQGVMEEEGTTNLLTANQASVETDLTGIDSYQATITRDTTTFWSGVACVKVVTNNTSANEGMRTLPSPTPATAGQTYTLTAYVKGSGTVVLGAGEMIGTAFQGWKDSAVYTLNNTWQRLSVTITLTAGCDGLIIGVRTNVQQAITFYCDGFQIENKAFATSWQLPGTARVAEVLTVPSSVFTKSNWTVKFEFTPTSNQVVTGRYGRLFELAIDASNAYRLSIGPAGLVFLEVVSGGVSKSIVDSTALVAGQPYSIMISGNGSVMRLCKNGAQVGADTAYVEPVGTLPTNMYIGSDSGGASQANGIISDFAVLNQPETLADHQADVNSGLPLSVTEYTTCLMSCDGTLQPTVRDFGGYLKNGRIIIQDPQTGQGFELWDGAVRKVLIGRRDDGTIGGDFTGCGVYASTVQTGAKGSGTYIGLFSDGSLVAKNNGKVVLQTWATLGDGNLSFGKAVDGTTFGRLLRYTDSYAGFGVESVVTGECLSLRSAGDVSAMPYGGGGGGYYFTVYGDSRNIGGTKYAVEETSEGLIGFAARESPEIRYIDEGRAELINGECRVDMAPLFIECTIPESDETPWHVKLTPKGPFTIYESEIGDTYFIVKSHEPGINGKFTWKVSAVRRGYAGKRFQRV